MTRELRPLAAQLRDGNHRHNYLDVGPSSLYPGWIVRRCVCGKTSHRKGDYDAEQDLMERVEETR